MTSAAHNALNGIHPLIFLHSSFLQSSSLDVELTHSNRVPCRLSFRFESFCQLKDSFTSEVMTPPLFPDKLSNMHWPWQPKEEPLGDPSIPSEYELRYRYGGGILNLPFEEIKALQQCSSDCNYKWALPASVIGAAAVAAGGMTGLLRISGPFNLAFKMGLAAVPGSFVGRWAYMRFGDCQKHLPQLRQHTPSGVDINTKLNDMAGYHLPNATNVAPYPGPASFQEYGPHGRGKM